MQANKRSAAALGAESERQTKKQKREPRAHAADAGAAAAAVSADGTIARRRSKKKPGPPRAKCRWCASTTCTHCHCDGFDGCDHAAGELCSRARYKRKLFCNRCDKRRMDHALKHYKCTPAQLQRTAAQLQRACAQGTAQGSSKQQLRMRVVKITANGQVTRIHLPGPLKFDKLRSLVTASYGFSPPTFTCQVVTRPGWRCASRLAAEILPLHMPCMYVCIYVCLWAAGGVGGGDGGARSLGSPVVVALLGTLQSVLCEGQEPLPVTSDDTLRTVRQHTSRTAASFEKGWWAGIEAWLHACVPGCLPVGGVPCVPWGAGGTPMDAAAPCEGLSRGRDPGCCGALWADVRCESFGAVRGGVASEAGSAGRGARAGRGGAGRALRSGLE